MCGVAGLIGLSEEARAKPETLEGMVSAIARRGPDDRGVFVDGPAGLGMCRLSIVDLSGGHQPISNEDGSVTLVCNGEIYNHGELRPALMRRGHRFKTGSDVEVILHLYEEYGTDCVHHLRGMFGFILWDAKRRRLFAARDRLGIKPLFYSEANGAVLIASEIKALLAAGAPKDISWRALQDYFTYGYILPPRTVFEDVRKLPPGHSLVVEGDRVEVTRYWRLDIQPGLADEAEWEERLLALLRETVKGHLMADVPLGAFLSGGVDSSLIVALMSEMTSTPVNTFTMGFGGNKGGYLDERGYARQVSRRYNTNHTEFEVQPKLEEILDEVVKAFDEPFADDSVIPSYYICQLAGRKVKVALTGLGGDELFGGYERYLGLTFSELYGRLPEFLRRGLIGPLVNGLPERRNGHYTVNHMKRFVRSDGLVPARRYKEYISVFNGPAMQAIFSPSVDRPSADPEAGLAPFEEPSAPTLLDRALYHDIHTYLPEDILALSDRLSMWHSLELRVPFVDHKVVEFCATIPASLKIRFREKKYLLRRLAKRFLPPEVLNHRKQGFASPLAAWLRSDLQGYVADALSPARLARHGFFQPEAVQRLLADHNDRRELNDKKIFTLLMFQKWFEAYIG